MSKRAGVSMRGYREFLTKRIVDRSFTAGCPLEAISANETRVRFTLDAEGWTVPLVGWLFGAIYRRNLERALPHLVEELDRLVPPKPA